MFESVMACSPFEWKYLDRCFEMEMAAGLLGVCQDERTKAVRPEVGWIMIEITDEKIVNERRAAWADRRKKDTEKTEPMRKGEEEEASKSSILQRGRRVFWRLLGFSLTEKKC